MISLKQEKNRAAHKAIISAAVRSRGKFKSGQSRISHVSSSQMLWPLNNVVSVLWHFTSKKKKTEPPSLSVLNTPSTRVVTCDRIQYSMFLYRNPNYMKLFFFLAIFHYL